VKAVHRSVTNTGELLPSMQHLLCLQLLQLGRQLSDTLFALRQLALLALAVPFLCGAVLLLELCQLPPIMAVMTRRPRCLQHNQNLWLWTQACHSRCAAHPVLLVFCAWRNCDLIRQVACNIIYRLAVSVTRGMHTVHTLPMQHRQLSYNAAACCY
jgi:hypothetical protein